MPQNRTFPIQVELANRDATVKPQMIANMAVTRRAVVPTGRKAGLVIRALGAAATPSVDGRLASLPPLPETR